MLYQTTKYDFLFQVRQGFYLVYGVLTAIYILLLFNIPGSVRMEVSAYIILTDTSVLGLTFVGALVLLEKQQNTLQSLFVTPLKLEIYLWAKVISLTVIAIVVSSLIGFVAGGLRSNWPATLAAVILSSIFFTFIGLGISAKVTNLNNYLAGTIVYGMTLASPIVLYFLYPEISIVFPINATVDLMITKPEIQTTKGLIADVSVLICWNILAFLFAKKQFMKHIIQK